MKRIALPPPPPPPPAMVISNARRASVIRIRQTRTHSSPPPPEPHHHSPSFSPNGRSLTPTPQGTGPDAVAPGDVSAGGEATTDSSDLDAVAGSDGSLSVELYAAAMAAGAAVGAHAPGLSPVEGASFASNTSASSSRLGSPETADNHHESVQANDVDVAVAVGLEMVGVIELRRELDAGSRRILELEGEVRGV